MRLSGNKNRFSLQLLSKRSWSRVNTSLSLHWLGALELHLHRALFGSGALPASHLDGRRKGKWDETKVGTGFPSEQSDFPEVPLFPSRACRSALGPKPTARTRTGLPNSEAAIVGWGNLIKFQGQALHFSYNKFHRCSFRASTLSPFCCWIF
jgi:hypothetical protein